jgi:dTDP-4-amino-4,6-dideoxygalactose transaminase
MNHKLKSTILMIPFSPPHIDQQTIDAVTRVLKSGWITTGPVTKQFEKGITDYCQSQSTLCLNSATAGLELVLFWFGVKEGDEVILPAYTYAATANVIIHRGATPVFVDVNPTDFNISIKAIEKAITAKTKVIIPVDFAGNPCDYDEIMNLVIAKKELFTPENEIQKKLGRMLVLSDSAHSFGAVYKGKRAGSLTDVSVFSFHAVKNITTAEGGAIALNLPMPFSNEEIYTTLSIKSQHGQNKNAFAKTQRGNWKYDVVEAGYKCNMTDIAAAMGLVELNRYDSLILKERKRIFKQYDILFSNQKWAELPKSQTTDKTGSFHLYTLRIKGITEEQRDAIIDVVFSQNVSVNVHFIPVPMLSFYKNNGYNMSEYPVAYDNYSREISLPVYFDLSPDLVDLVAAAVIKAVDKVLNNR